MKQKLLQAMEEHGVKSFENAKVKFMYVAPTTRTTIDSKKLKADHPDIVEAYSKTSNVSASVRITVKQVNTWHQKRILKTESSLS